MHVLVLINHFYCAHITTKYYKNVHLPHLGSLVQHFCRVHITNHTSQAILTKGT